MSRERDGRLIGFAPCSFLQFSHTLRTPSAMPGHSDPLSSLGLSAAQIKELTKLLRNMHSAEEEPYAALDALLEVSSLAQPDDASRTVLMGGSILDALADLICICDEEWISGEEHKEEDHIIPAAGVHPVAAASHAPSRSAAADPDADPHVADSGVAGDDDDAESRRLSLELCSRALNALGSMASFVPFVSSVLEEDRTDEPMDAEAFEPIAREINRAAAASAAAAAPSPVPATPAVTSAVSSSAVSSPFRVRQFLSGSVLSFYPLLTACLFWLCCPRFRGVCQPQAAYALSWLLVLRPVALMMHEAGLAAVLFGILREQQHASAAGRSSRAGTPDSTSSGTSASERVSSTQENLRLFTLICLQRLSRTDGLRLFSDPLETPAVLDARLETLLKLLSSVHSFNIRAIVLNILLQAVTAPNMALTTPLPRRANAAAATTSKPAPDLVLPPSALATLRDFRASCGSIGSAASSRRTSPALGAIVAPVHRIPSATLGSAAASGAAAAATAATSVPVRSWRAVAAPPPSSSSAASSVPAPAAAVSVAGTAVPAVTTPSTADPISSVAPALAATTAAVPSAVSSASSSAVPAPASSAAASVSSAVSLDDDEVSELSRDPEAALDKTAHLQQLVDAILEQAQKANADTQAR